MRDNVSAQLTSVQRDRACGVLLGIAAGDARATARSGEWMLDTVRAVEQLRGGGRTVFVHSMLGTGRAPAVASLYGARRQGIGIEEALRAVLEVVPEADIDNVFLAALHRLAAA